MLLNALSNYLQNQPLAKDVSSDEIQSKASQRISSTEITLDKDLGQPYAASGRDILIDAVASEFDVSALPASQLSSLQNRLQQYGLLALENVEAMSVLHQAHATNRPTLNAADPQNSTADAASGFQSEMASIDALAVIAEAHQSAQNGAAPYKQRQQLGHLNTLFQNLASSYQHLSTMKQNILN
ncbi:MAG: hypothetical protein P1U57_06925 [Oleibacter sp.]|nr:hypothetical protein [Thalassolituus sp.]